MASQLVEEDVQSVVSSSSMSDIDSLSDADLYPEIVENESGDRENVLMPRGDETTHQSVSVWLGYRYLKELDVVDSL